MATEQEKLGRANAITWYFRAQMSDKICECKQWRSHFARIKANPTAITRISNGNRTEWSPIRSAIIRVINKIGRPRSGSPICLITSMITD